MLFQTLMEAVDWALEKHPPQVRPAPCVWNAYNGVCSKPAITLHACMRTSILPGSSCLW